MSPRVLRRHNLDGDINVARQVHFSIRVGTVTAMILYVNISMDRVRVVTTVISLA